MKCPKCDSDNAVVDSRYHKSKAGNQVRLRRRICLNNKCNHRFSTVEIERCVFDGYVKITRLIAELMDAFIRKNNKKADGKNTKTVRRTHTLRHHGKDGKYTQ
ncbi:hypothetical protein LCGC14_1006990 [marine sediment metagenome]|uniref:Transcriptional repressor NrdR-like N-terminal domain-containing protein n=1 Tax=marine sediment metagenome TaxID=412755 RepID=A0A0F9N1I4_9ZZZZ